MLYSITIVSTIFYQLKKIEFNMNKNDTFKIEKVLNEFGLTNLGIVVFNNRFLKKYETAILIGPDEPFFWDIFKKSKEFNSLVKNPLNKWSKRIIDRIAKKFSGTAFYPFQNNPIIPFYQWALNTGKFWESPVKLLVHERRGLMVSFRGAIAFENRNNFNIQEKKSPCLSCSAPCLRACPVNAFKNNKYDVKSCMQFIKNSENSICMDGCLVRRGCPIGQSYRKIEQSRFHMKHFINEVY